MFRALQRLSFGERFVEPGTLLSTVRGLDITYLSPESAEILLRKGAIAEVSSPPLSEITGWAARSRRLKLLGIEAAVEFLEAEKSVVRRSLGVSESQLAMLRKEIMNWLRPSTGTGSGSGSRG